LSYRIFVERQAERALRRRIAPENASRVRRALDGLAEDPRPQGSTSLQGRPGYRIRVGDYRIVYEVDDEQRTVTVFQVGHRRDVYRRG
jgi:mRNA interferase RelE/StbE